jgi:hypothetical protein
MRNDACRAAVLLLADIKAAVADFDRGESNLFVVLERIRTAVSLVSDARDDQFRHDAA